MVFVCEYVLTYVGKNSFQTRSNAYNTFDSDKQCCFCGCRCRCRCRFRCRCRRHRRRRCFCCRSSEWFVIQLPCMRVNYEKRPKQDKQVILAIVYLFVHESHSVLNGCSVSDTATSRTVLCCSFCEWYQFYRDLYQKVFDECCPFDH